jgi:transketolase
MPKTTQVSILGNPYNKIVTLEALSTFGWAKIGAFNLGIDRFGVSAPGDVAMKACGIDLAQLIQRIQEWMQ